MDGFPEFGGEEIRIEDNNENNENNFNNDNIQNNYQPYEDNNQEPNWNIQSIQIENNPISDPFGSYQVDEEEENRQRQRKAEEDERRTKLMQKMNDEIRVKQEGRDKAKSYLDNWNV
jgi:hypothetical protein